jgi:hypothetical protein
MRTDARLATAVEHDRAAVEALMRRPMMLAELAEVLDVKPTNATTVMARLKRRGITVESQEWDDGLGRHAGRPRRLYWVTFPAGRVCAHEGCGTILRRTNPAPLCELHGGGTVDALIPDPPPLPRLKRKKWCPMCKRHTTDFSSHASYCRRCWRENRLELRGKVKTA